jgi:hypothetical protein
MDFYAATTSVVEPDSSQLRSEVKDIVKDEGGSGIQYEHLRNDIYRNPKYTTLTSEEELEDAIDSLCRDGVIQVGNYFEQSVGSLGNDTNLVHEQYVTEEEDEEDDDDTITIDTTGGDGGDGGGGGVTTTGGTTTTTGGGDGGGSTTTATTAFNCPQCGDELVDNSCECGFEFTATDLREGKVSVEGATTEELLEEFGIDEDVGPKIRPHPPMGTIDADNKPDLIDQLERDIGIEWEVHEAEITVEGQLTSADLEDYGLSIDALDERVTLDETFNIDPDEPFSRQGFLSLVWDLNVPENASVSVSLQVDKDE